MQKVIVEAYKKKDSVELEKAQAKLLNSIEARWLAVYYVKGGNTPGVDLYVPKTDFELIEIQDRLKDWRNYKASPVRRVYIPKTNSEKKRPLGIPTFYDRCMQSLFTLVLTPIAEYESDFNSYGYRSGKSQFDAITAGVYSLMPAVRNCKIYPRYALCADIKGFFDNVSHEWILENIPMDKNVLKEFLRCGYIDNKILVPTVNGVPQGGTISPVISNMVLNGLEKRIKYRMITLKYEPTIVSNVRFVRYADDFFVTYPFPSMEIRIRWVIENFLKARGLSLNMEKTKVVDTMTDNKGIPFLGVRIIRAHKNEHNTANLLTVPLEQQWILVKPQKTKIKDLLSKVKTILKNYNWPVEDLINKLNPLLIGWSNYFAITNGSQEFRSIDRVIWKWFLKWYMKKHKLTQTAAMKRFLFKEKQHTKPSRIGYQDGNKGIVYLFKLADTKWVRKHKLRRGTKFV